MSDTDEHELVIESTGPKLSTRIAKPKMLCPVQPCNEERERQQKIADEKLLADAGISDLNNDEERQQILEVLRQSLPEGPITSSSVSASAASHSQYTQQMDDGGESPHADVSMEYQQTPEVEIRSASSSPKPTHRQESSSITGQSVLQPQVHGSGVQGQRKAQRKCEKESDDGTESGPEPASDLDQRVRPKRTLRASVRRLETSSDSDCVGEPQKKRLLKSGTDASSDSDQSIRPLQERVTQKLKLTSEQRHNMGDKLRTMYFKTKSFPSSQSELVGGKEPETPRSSQDLFTAGEGEEEKTGAGSQNSASQSTPADLPTFKACDKEEAETSGLDMEVEEVETLPPYSPAASLDSREGKEDVEDEDSVLSQEFPIQSTQARTIPIVMEDAVLTPASAPSPEPAPRVHEKDGDEKEEEELEVTGEEDEERRPLSHDNWFCWSHSPREVPQALERKYRKRKWSLEADKTYFRPLNVDPAIFSGQILQLFNKYFACFTTMQSTLSHKLPWGKPVKAGFHHSSTIDQKHRREQSHVTFQDDDDDDDFASAPAAKKPAIGEGVLKRTAHRTGSDRGIGSVQRTDTPVNSELGASSLNPWSSAASQTMEDTQPYDFDDDELPDISLNPGTKSGATNPLDVKTAMYLNDENKQAGKERLHSPPIDSSQSSNSRLDENGDLYPTQLPSRETKKGDCGAPSGEFFDDDDFVEESLSQRKQGASQSRQDRNEGPRLPRRNVSRSATDKPDAGEHSQAASRKRKQANDSSEVNLLELSDDEPSYPQKRKREVTSTVSSKGQGRQVKISMCADTSRYTATAAVIPPSTHIRTGGSSLSQQDSSQETKSKYFPGYERKGASHDTGTGECAGLSDAGQDPAIIGGTDDEDSVQFISLVHLDNGKERGQYQGATYSRAHSAKQKVPVQVMAEVEPRVECPLCGKQFPSSRIEQHASDCQGGEEEELVPQRATGTNPLFPRGQTSRRPLHQNPREPHNCPYCDKLLQGMGARERHLASCKEKETKRQHMLELERDIVSGTGMRSRIADRAGPSHTFSQEGGWLKEYKIPKTGPSSKRQTTSSAPAQADEVEIEEVPSDDSDRDPDFALTKDDFQQVKEDIQEDRDSHIRHKQVSDMPDNATDLKNQSSGKRKMRQAKLKGDS